MHHQRGPGRLATIHRPPTSVRPRRRSASGSAVQDFDPGPSSRTWPTSRRCSRFLRRGRTPTIFKFEDDGNNWADDADYTIAVNWLGSPTARSGSRIGAAGPASAGQHAADRVPELRHRRHRHQPRHRADHRREGLRRPRRRRGHLRGRRPVGAVADAGSSSSGASPPHAGPGALRPGHPSGPMRTGRRRRLRQRPDADPDRRQPARAHLRHRAGDLLVELRRDGDAAGAGLRPLLLRDRCPPGTCSPCSATTPAGASSSALVPASGTAKMFVSICPNQPDVLGDQRACTVETRFGASPRTPSPRREGRR